MKEGYIMIKCRGCGSEYEMPNIGVIPVMEDCPVCKQIKKGIDDILREIGV